MDKNSCIAVLGTFDSKAEEHNFLKQRIELRGLQVLTINVGTGAPSPIQVDLDLFDSAFSTLSALMAKACLRTGTRQ